MLNSSVSRKIASFAAAVLLCGVALAQTSAVAPRITQRVSDAQRTVLHGNTLPIAQAKYDQGAVPSGTPANRMLLVLKEVEGHSVEELAEQTGMNENTIKVKLFRARQKLVKAAQRLERGPLTTTAS